MRSRVCSVDEESAGKWEEGSGLGGIIGSGKSGGA